MLIRTVKDFSFKNSIMKYLITNPILNVSPQKASPFVRSFSIKIPVKKIDPKIKVPEDPYLLTKLIKKLGEQDNLNDALSITFNTKISAQSEVVWNHLIDECVKRGKLKLGIRLLNEMKNRAFIPNQQTYTILLNGIAENLTFEDNITQAKNLLENMQQLSIRYSQVKVNVIHINCLLKVCARSNNFEALIENFNELMINKGDWEPDQETFTIILNACARQNDGHEIALKLWNQLDINSMNKQQDYQQKINQELEWNLIKRSNNVKMDDNLVRSMLMVCKNFGDYKKGFEIIKNFYGLETDDNLKTTSKSLPFICNLSPQTLDIILGICIVNKQYEKGIKLFDDALNKFPNLSLDIYNFNKLIDMCNKSEQYDRAISTMKTIQERDLYPSLETYDLLITSCSKNEDWATAKDLYEDMLYSKKFLFDSRILNKMFELAETQIIKNKSLTEIKWLLDSSHGIVSRNFITLKENENMKKKYHYKKLLKQVIRGYQSVLDKESDLTNYKRKLLKQNIKKFKSKLLDAKNWEITRS